MRFSSLSVLCSFSLIALLSGCAQPDPSVDEEDASIEEVDEAEEALAGCSGEGCNGQDPGLMGCEADAVTVASSTIRSPAGLVVGTIAIRKSAACNAFWARASTSSGTAYILSTITRNSPYATAQGASPTPVSALRSPMVGVWPGATYTANGSTGPSYGYYPNFGTVSK